MSDLRSVLEASGVHQISRDAEQASIIQRVMPSGGANLMRRSLARAADVLETRALSLTGREQTNLFSQAFACWRDVADAGVAEVLLLEDGYLDRNLALAFHLGVTGVLAERPSEAEHALAQVLPSASEMRSGLTADSPRDWRDLLLRDVAIAVTLLIRKDDGWADVQLALELMDGLRAKQTEWEEKYLDGGDDTSADRRVMELVACYHLAQLVTTTGTYLQSGNGGRGRVVAELERHRDRALEAAEQIHDGVLSRLARMTSTVAVVMVSGSVWAQLGGVGAKVEEFAAQLASAQAAKPLFELWPSQKQALQQNLLDAYARAVVVQMPTSAGKTLLAKLSIVQTLALNPKSTIAYVVPTRVLVNQVMDELRRDLRGLGYTVEQATPAIQIDPTEDALLETPPSVLVTTPEKLDLLVRDSHPSVANLSQVVVDEAHNISDGVRGAKLELLLATIRRDRANVRFLLLSPFLPGSEMLADWLGDDERATPIRVEWRPNQRVVASIDVHKVKNLDYDVFLETAEAADKSNLPSGFRMQLSNENSRPSSLKELTAIATNALRHRDGVTLILCRGKSTAMNRAEELSESMPLIPGSAFRSAVIAHVRDELGPKNPLEPLLIRGVAYHHAGMSHETRRLIEQLVNRGEIRIVCGTTTLSQGVNFPINNVIIESRQKGRGGEMTFADFWNTAGRAGRGRLSDLGVVAYPVVTEQQRDGWEEFLRQEAAEVASQLTGLIADVDAIADDLGYTALIAHETLSPFLQYLAHAMKVSGAKNAAEDVEDLLRNSLVYRQAVARDQELGARLAKLCRAYLQKVGPNPGLVALADGTGFSTITVDMLRNRATRDTTISDHSSWMPGELFGKDLSVLTGRVNMLGALPELDIGNDDLNGPFNPARIAEILRDWVSGTSMEDMVAKYGDRKQLPYARSAKFASYLYSTLASNASWGMGALQRVAWAGTEPSEGDIGAYVPSMVFYGVNTREAIWMRMVGLPREAARRAASAWSAAGRSEPESYSELREFVGGMTAGDWDRYAGASNVSGDQMKLLWDELG
ncbi:DEAD/DEAH box helicase [Microbacterium sp. BF1]|uniref:DEAD/DEAH box helicase n=1 Tax=Microbacterium sp. BF1 TaxID=2821146 RepID=UPI001C4E1EAF|nr:DEAD/DEAH box helicase [Microbacterium sp. BF1]